MIDGAKIRLNARSKVREYVKQIRHQEQHSLSLNVKLTQIELDEHYKSQLRGALKGINVNFKKCNIESAILKSEHFSSIKCLFSGILGYDFCDKDAILFIKDCLMIEVAFRCQRLPNGAIEERGIEFADKVADYMLNLLFDLVSEVGDFFISDMLDKTILLAENFYVSVQNGGRQAFSSESAP